MTCNVVGGTLNLAQRQLHIRVNAALNQATLEANRYYRTQYTALIEPRSVYHQ